MSFFSIESTMRGYHAYRDIWSASLDEELVCAREPDNYSDPLLWPQYAPRTQLGIFQEDFFGVCVVSSTRRHHLKSSSDSVGDYVTMWSPPTYRSRVKLFS